MLAGRPILISQSVTLPISPTSAVFRVSAGQTRDNNEQIRNNEEFLFKVSVLHLNKRRKDVLRTK
jgi:hypothetical protein